ncbi:hypothetical protein Bca101_055943 [Brassica carinata]
MRMTVIGDLPDDLESEILSRVPAKSLSELQGTCKRWYALFRDPKFVEKNKKMGKAVSVSMLLSKHDVCSIEGELHNNGVEPSIEFKLTSLKGSKDFDFSQIFHCDGLILCYLMEISRLVVWNPCTGQRRDIKPRTYYRCEDIYALGYITSSSSDHSYKILRCCYYRNGHRVWVGECDMYDFCSDSWRVLDPFTLDHTLFFNGMFPISLRGDTYSVARDGETGFFLMKFDFTTERFVRLSLPFQSFAFADTVVLSVVRDEKLSVLHIGRESNVMRGYGRSVKVSKRVGFLVNLTDCQEEITLTRITRPTKKVNKISLSNNVKHN